MGVVLFLFSRGGGLSHPTGTSLVYFSELLDLSECICMNKFERFCCLEHAFPVSAWD